VKPSVGQVIDLVSGRAHPPSPPCSAGQTPNLGAVTGWLRPFSRRQKKPRRVWIVRAGLISSGGARGSV